ncbi:UTP--glucose-1-phosphate uridylyltransferase [Oscillochloris sp. ZM17-4]|uniref:UTP--glucose-1-phosphate uridylyltransferase n=1 Tax=Oscillochloris sp. ZM17-4 TaxID=2866714 RepID=UPI001C72FF3B|nr:UTP--glucose-1-phosphate uridylyltransferase [Oscillochloris sp. ZM17-4]MBX0328433.1 UTP--glucose-1-phosphate uridylyltransferase [Oscillochloris sp. ZM17-4]
MSTLTEIITAADAETRDRSLDAFCRGASLDELLAECAALERLRRTSDNLYERVRALFFLYAIHRFHLLDAPGVRPVGHVPYEGYAHLLSRRFEEAIQVFQAAQADGPSAALCSALAAAYHRLAFQTLADQVRRSVRSVRGNQWMFRVGHPADHPLRVRRELLPGGDAPALVLRESTPVRMDLTHSAWSDIFFLGMDFPEGARVLNVSIDLGVRGRDPAPRPPVEASLRVIDEPVLRLTSVDLGASADITDLAEVFDFARDHLGLLKAAVIASGIVPPGIEGSGAALGDLLARLTAPGHGIELVSAVHGIPKGSRLAVSTNLLASLIAVCMRATGQARALTGPLDEGERRLAAARAILGEWLAGSGGGWQDSGGVWPGMKLIRGEEAQAGDPEWGVSRGRLLPSHRILGEDAVSPATRAALQASLVLVHGGMAQNVGPILEMVTEKYLLRSEAEWAGRRQAIGVLDEVLAALRDGDIRRIGALTTANFFGPLQTIIPWASTRYTEALIEAVRAEFGDDFWGFWMLGGMSGGGMGFIFAPGRRAEAQSRLQAIMAATKAGLEHALPFAMEPVVYDFAINERGTVADLLSGEMALMPPGYYALTVPGLLRQDPRALTAARRAELDRFAAACRTMPELSGMVQTLFDRLLPRAGLSDDGQAHLGALLAEHGFDRAQHEQIRADMRSGRIGLLQNRLPSTTRIRDVEPGDVADAAALGAEHRRLGARALAAGEVAVVSLAGGAGSRWTQGAGVVKALHPFARLAGRHRSFVEAHLAKSRRSGREHGAWLPHIFTTSYLTHGPLSAALAAQADAEGRPYGYAGPLLLSPGRAVGLRLIPMARDLRFAWEETPQQVLDEQAQKVRESLHAALIGWARGAGEGGDYTGNAPLQCLHPVGHWFELPNMLRNGALARLLAERPQLTYLMAHNIDTLGATVDPAILGLHIARGDALTFEVIARHLDDRGGGLARVDGQLRLLEGLAMPREQAEFDLSYYNTLTCWVDIDRLLAAFGLTRDELADDARVADAVRALAARIPTYMTLKDVKKRWGHGQEDIFPVAQWEKLWGDMTALPDLACGFVAVPRLRGQQLKDQAQLDGWLRDGSAAYVEALCDLT